jgi:hypothetical protein
MILLFPFSSTYSEHNYYGSDFASTKEFIKSPYRFHYRTTEMIGMYKDCFKRYPIRACVYDPNLIYEGDIAEVNDNRVYILPMVGDSNP